MLVVDPWRDCERIYDIHFMDRMRQYFLPKKDIVKALKDGSKIAEKKGIKTIEKFFGVETADKLKKNGYEADLLIAINVLPHVPNIKDFVEGIKKILKHNGVCIIQFSTYMLPFLSDTEFDSIYHEHFSYFSMLSIQKILTAFELLIFDVEELSIHGGSLRMYVKHAETGWKTHGPASLARRPLIWSRKR